MITATDASGTAPTQNPFETSAGMLGKAGDIFAGLSEDGSLANINNYLNPYYDQVLDSVLGRMKTNHEHNINNIGDQVASAGAFGGSRHGVMEGVATGEYNKNIGDVSNNIYATAFDRAADLAYRDQTTAAGGLTSLGKDYFNIGKQNAADQMSAGTTQQDLWQQILSGGADQFGEFMNDPYKMIDMLNALQSGDARRGQGTNESQSTPGLFDYLSLFAQSFGG